MFGYFLRKEACKLAAQTLRANDVKDGYTPTLWGLCVFYENYLSKGAAATIEDFGPKEPIELKLTINE